VGEPAKQRSGRGRPPLPPLPILILALAALAATPVLVMVALRASEDGPVAIVEEQEGPFRGGVLPADLAGGPAPTFEHLDARSREPFGTADVAGMPYIVTFLFTDCPDVCPLIGQEVRQALEELGPRSDDVGVLVVSVDPEGDTPESVRAWLERYEMPANVHYLIGDEAELEGTWEAYFAAPQVQGQPESTHTASIWLVDAEGRLRTKFSGGMPVPPADIAHDLDLLLDDAERRDSAAAAAGAPAQTSSRPTRSGSGGSILSGSP
jgi:protein SCO1/2